MRSYSYFALPRAKTVNYGLESLSYIGSKLWDSIPSHKKEIDSLKDTHSRENTLSNKTEALTKSICIFGKFID